MTTATVHQLHTPTGTPADLARLLHALGRDPAERMSVCHLDRSQFRSELTTVGNAVQVASRHAGGDCWFGTQVLHSRVKAGRGLAKDVVGVRDLCADLDVKPGGLPSNEAALEVIKTLSEMLGTGPVAIVSSGHGLQPHWAIERGDDTDWPDETDPRHADAVALWRRWGRLVAHVARQLGGATDSVFDLARVMRTPGTVNRKVETAPKRVGLALLEGAPVSLARVAEACDEFGVAETAEDREVLGEVVAKQGDWQWAERTCGYVATLLNPAGGSDDVFSSAVTGGWAGDTPKARHPWLLAQATRLAAAHRLGCITEADHARAAEVLTARFRHLLNTGARRDESETEIADAFTWGVARVEQYTEQRARQDLGSKDKPHEHQVETDEVPDFWQARPALSHVRTFAQARLCSPWSVLGVVLARVVTATPPFVVLPAIVGSEASLNLFVALTGPSGGGKGASESAAADAVDVGAIDVASVGSGEGIGHLYAHREKGDVIRDREAVLFTVPEVDNLTALGNRQGATLLPQLRMAWSGERLGFSYADKNKALPIERHTYRMGMVLGVQPGRAAPLLEDSDGGTPQRFVWLPTTDPNLPGEPPPCPEPLRWRLPAPWHSRDGRGLAVMPVPQIARDAIINARREGLRGTGNPLDGHALLARLKVAAALALLDERQAVDEQDWRLAGHVMVVSDITRAGVAKHLADKAAKADEFRGESEGRRAVVVAERLEHAKVQRVARSIRRAMSKHPGWMSERDVRAAVSSVNRGAVPEALAALSDAGQIEASDDAGRQLYRLTDGGAS